MRPQAIVGRRAFLKAGAATAASSVLQPLARLPGAALQSAMTSARSFNTSEAAFQHLYDRALHVLASNVQLLPRFNAPVLIEGSSYAGIWLECAPHEGLVYRHIRPDVARNNHMAFFALQRPDGQLPANNRRSSLGFGQIQMVVPIAATAWELAEATGDAQLLEAAYTAASRWDDWLVRFRDTRGTGLIEGFCTYDTGMDNSPRWAGCDPQCPQEDAKLCPKKPTLPRLCPDLSATVYGGRTALASMARALGKNAEADRWLEHAEKLRTLILKSLYDAEDNAFYDVDATGHFVRIRCDILTRVCGEHVVEPAMFQTLWNRQLGRPAAFWPSYPFPSVAEDDPHFVPAAPANSWGGPSQALTALRATRWMEHYGRHAELAHLMQQWQFAILRSATFAQQIDPGTGEFTPGGLPGYSPAALLFYDFSWRLAGVTEAPGVFHWNVRNGSSYTQRAVFRATYGTHRTAVAMQYSDDSGTLVLNEHPLAKVTGTARIVTDEQGTPLYAVGIHQETQHIRIEISGRPTRSLVLGPNEKISL